MSEVDRLTGLRSGAAVKAPVVAATTTAITLEGEQTIAGVACVTGDRVLVKAQSSSVDNGIYIVDTSEWERAPDFAGQYDVVTGTMVFDIDTLVFWYVSTTGDITVDTTAITFAQAPIDTSGASAYFATLFSAADAAALRALEGQTRIAYATAGGTVDAITAAFGVTFASFDQTALILVQCGGANTSTTPTLTLDSLAAKTIVKGSNQALSAGDIAGADFLAMFRYDTSLDKFQLLNPSSGVAPVAQAVVALGQNFGIAVTLGSNAMTIELKDKDGNDPSVASPVTIGVQSATETTGTFSNLTRTSSMSRTIPSGATVGTSDGNPSRIYFGVLDNAGALEACIWNPITTEAAGLGAAFRQVTGILRVSPASVFNTLAIGTGADSAGVIYSGSVRSNVRVIPLAYIDSEQTTAGLWADAIVRVVLIGPQTPNTGDIVQESTDFSGAVATGTTVVALDDTVPDSADGDAYLTPAVITKHSQSNIVEVEFVANFASTVASDGFVGFVDSTSGGGAVLTQAGNIVATGDQIILSGKKRLVHDLQTVDFSLRAGSSAAGTTTFNGRASARLYGGTMGSYMTVREIQA